MKHLKLFEDFVNRDVDFIYSDVKADRGVKATWSLKLGPSVWKHVEHLFDEKGRPKHPSVSKIGGKGAAWSLYAAPYTVGGKEMHRIYGVSGDYSFGFAPGYYSSQYAGNKRAAKEVYDHFIDEHIIKIEWLKDWLQSGKTLDEYKHEKRGAIANKKFMSR
jgi:hypothetical protein